VFVIVNHIRHCLIFAGMTTHCLSGDPLVLLPKGRLHALPANIRQVWKCLTVSNTLAYCDTEFIMSVKKFYTTWSEGTYTTMFVLQSSAISLMLLTNLINYLEKKCLSRLVKVKKYISVKIEIDKLWSPNM
jgi:hypothetical protein